MPKIAIIADTHAGIRGNSEPFIELQNNFYKELFFPTLKKHSVKTIVHLGDFFDNRKSLSPLVIKSARLFIQELVDADMSMHLVIGNHDTYFKNTNEINTPELVFGEVPNVRIHSKKLGMVEIGNKMFGFLPWLCDENRERCLQVLADNKKDIDVLCAHLELSGFEMYRGQVCDHGMDAKPFAKIPLVLTGHYHHQSNIGNIHYVGSPHQATWADYGDVRGFHLYDTDNDELEFIPNTNELFVQIDYYAKLSKKVDVRGKYVKVIVKEREQASKFEADMQKLYEQNPLDLQIIDDTLVSVSEIGGRATADALSQDTVDVIEDCTKEVELPDEMQKELSTLMRSLYLEAIGQ